MFSRIFVILTLCNITLTNNASQQRPNPDTVEYLSSNPLNKRYSYAQVQEWQFDKQYNYRLPKLRLATPPSVQIMSAAACGACGGVLGFFVDIVKDSSFFWLHGTLLGVVFGTIVSNALPYNPPPPNFLRDASSSINEVINNDREFSYYMLKQNPEIVTLVGKCKKTALILAAKRGSCNTVKSLLRQKTINIHHKDYIGWTALHYAVNYGHEKVVKELLNAGAKLDKETALQLTHNKLGSNKDGSIRKMFEISQ